MEGLEIGQKKQNQTSGRVVKAFGNLLQVQFKGNIRQGEVAYVTVDQVNLKAEVIEIIGDEAKIQVFEDTKGVSFGTEVLFTGDLLEAELGPGLLSSVVDGLQNPLEDVAKISGHFLPRGIYLKPLDRKKHWSYEPVAAMDDVLERGDTLGTTLEGRFTHHVMVPFALFGTYKITWVISPGSYHVDTVIAKAVDENGREHAFTMCQKWPIKNALIQGEKIKPTKMMDTGERIIDTQFPIIKGGTF